MLKCSNQCIYTVLFSATCVTPVDSTITIETDFLLSTSKFPKYCKSWSVMPVFPS